MIELLFRLFVVALALVMPVFQAFAISLIWRWFAVPLGVPPISIAQAYAAIVLVAIATMKVKPGESAKAKATREKAEREDSPGFEILRYLMGGVAVGLGLALAYLATRFQ